MQLEKELRSKELLMAVGALPKTGFVAKQLEENEAKYLSRPGGLPIDLVFNYRAGKAVSENGFKASKYAGLRLFGQDNVIGVSIVSSEEEQLAVREKLMTDAEMAYLIGETGARVAIMDEVSYLEWVAFYQRLDRINVEEGVTYLESLGVRAEELAGLSLFDEVEQVKVVSDVDALIEQNTKFFKKNGVKLTKGYYGLDYGFLTKKGDRLSPITLCHIRTGRMEDGFLVEKVEDEMDNVIGLSIRKPGQSKRDHYAMVAQMEEEMNASWGTSGNPYRIVPVSLGTTKLWRKIGMTEHPKGDFDGNKEVEETIMRAFRTLFWGQDTLHPGYLARLGYSMPGYGDMMRFEKLDGVLLKRDIRGKSVYATIDGLVAMKNGRKVQLGNVGGFIVFPVDMPFEEREEYAKAAQVDFNKRTGLARRNLWHLDADLLSLIEEQGTPFMTSDDDEEIEPVAISPRKSTRYFQNISDDPGKRELYLNWFRQKPTVGGDKQFLELKSGQTIYSLLFDLGYTFNPEPSAMVALRQLGRMPPTHDGLRRLLTTGELVMYPGVYEMWYLEMTARNWPALASEEVLKQDPVARYTVAELFGRYSKAEIRERLPKDIARAVIKNGPNAVEMCYGDMVTVITGATPTHFHWDHMGGVPYLDKKIPQLWSGPTYAAALGASYRANTWRNLFTVSKDINAPRSGNQPYPGEEKDVQVYWKSGVTQRLSPLMNQTSWLVDHSAISSWKITEIDMGGGREINLFNSADWRMGDYTERALNDIVHRNFMVDAIVQEGTRLARPESREALAATEETVRDSFSKYLSDTKGTTRIVAVSPRSFQRIHDLVEVAVSAGYKVALSDAHSIDALQYAAVKEIAPMGAEGFEWVLPHVLGEDGVTVWAKKMTTPRSHHAAVRTLADQGDLGLLTPERLSKGNEAGRWVILVSPYEILQDQFGGVNLTHGVSMFWSAPSVYEKGSRDLWTVNKNWLMGAPFHGGWFGDFEVVGGTVRSVKNKYGRAHTSGHATSKQIRMVLDTLVGRDRKNVPVYLVHTDKPDEAAEALKPLGNKIKIVSSFPKYDPKDPFVKSGARFRLA